MSDDFSSINFKYIEGISEEIVKHSKSKIINSPDLINLKFWEIFKASKWLPHELKFLWNVLRSRRTRFSLSLIYLKFSLLSECLAVLSLCSEFTELLSVCFQYSESDTENEHEAVEQAKREFIQKFGFIKYLTITKYSE